MLRGDGPDVCEAIESLCVVTKDSFAGPAGEPLIMRPWQRALTGDVFARRADGRLRHRVALVGLPRKNGKSAGPGAGYAIEGLVFGGRGAEVYSAAGDKEQARIVFGIAKSMVEDSEALSEIITPYRDVLEVKSTGSIYRCLSAEAFTKEGLNPTRVIFDEVHVQPNDELWNVLQLAMAARFDPLMIGITTAGVMTDSSGNNSLCYRMYQYGCDVAAGVIDDPSFYFAWWGAAPDADHRDPAVWESANPAYGDLVDPEDFAATVKRTPENEFRTKRLNQWVTSASSWFPVGVWDECKIEDLKIEDGEEVVVGLDGSYNNDSTALVAATLASPMKVEVIGLWQKTEDDDDEWTVDVLAVEQAIRDVCKRLRVREVDCDPARFVRSLQLLRRERLPIVEYPQTPERMIPAAQRFYEAVMNRTLSHNGDADFARHIRNATLKTTERGSRIVKDTKGSDRKIDLAIAAVIAVDRASALKPRSSRVVDLAAALAAADASTLVEDETPEPDPATAPLTRRLPWEN